jgi:hypothetical protein
VQVVSETQGGPDNGALPRDVMAIFDDDPAAGYACRICGALVSRIDRHAEAHWDWHEASNGA